MSTNEIFNQMLSGDFSLYMNFFRFFVNFGGNISSISVCIK